MMKASVSSESPGVVGVWMCVGGSRRCLVLPWWRVSSDNGDSNRRTETVVRSFPNFASDDAKCGHSSQTL
jgi:hypothetical protein